MVACGNNSSVLLSPRPTLNLGVRGVSKQSGPTSRFATNKGKRAQRALCTLFEEKAYDSSPFFSVKGWLGSPGSKRERLNTSSTMHPALMRLRMQDCRDTPTLRKATPIKEKPIGVRSAFGRYRMQRDLDALAHELGTCQLQSALKSATAKPLSHGQAPAPVEPVSMASMTD